MAPQETNGLQPGMSCRRCRCRVGRLFEHVNPVFIARVGGFAGFCPSLRTVLLQTLLRTTM